MRTVRYSFNICRCANYCSHWTIECQPVLKTERTFNNWLDLGNHADYYSQLRKVLRLVLVPFLWMFFYCLQPYMFFPFCSLITCIGWAGLCLYSWIHPFQGLFLDLHITECHNSRKSSKHCFLQGEINFSESHKDCMAVVFFLLVIIQHQGHLNEFDFSLARQSTSSASFCWFNKVSSPSQLCFQIMETVQTEHALLNLNQKCNKISLKNKSSKFSICITKSVPSQYKHTENPEREIETLPGRILL